jgi:hypothetical protein
MRRTRDEVVLNGMMAFETSLPVLAERPFFRSSNPGKK